MPTYLKNETKRYSKFSNTSSKFKSILKVVVYFSSHQRNTEHGFHLEPAAELKQGFQYKTVNRLN